LDFYRYSLGLDSTNEKKLLKFWQKPLNFFPQLQQADINSNFKSIFPGRVDAILKHADSICERRYSILGLAEIDWSQNGETNWHLDPVNDVVAPLDWWARIDTTDFKKNGDPKIIWELNRHQHFVHLGIAYLLTDNDDYRDAFLKNFLSWAHNNPPKFGINWVSSLELAYRSIAWIWAYHLFTVKEGLPTEIFKLILKYLAIQAGHIEHNLSTYYSPNTHLTGEALGLYYIGSFLNGYRPATRWKRLGSEVLLQEISRQVLSDGGYIERSLWYHRYTLDIYIHFLVLARWNEDRIPGYVGQRVEALAEFMMYSARPDRSFPLIGDDDGGQLIKLDSLAGNDLRGLFSTLSIYFERRDFKFLSEEYAEETYWLLGPESLKSYDAQEPLQPSHSSIGFKETGYFFTGLSTI